MTTKQVVLVIIFTLAALGIITAPLHSLLPQPELPCIPLTYRAQDLIVEERCD